jgi:hypothetical protein
LRSAYCVAGFARFRLCVHQQSEVPNE